jgi:hypothetical protein
VSFGPDVLGALCEWVSGGAAADMLVDGMNTGDAATGAVFTVAPPPDADSDDVGATADTGVRVRVGVALKYTGEAAACIVAASRGDWRGVTMGDAPPRPLGTTAGDAPPPPLTPSPTRLR